MLGVGYWTGKQLLGCRRWDWKANSWVSEIGLKSSWLGVGDWAGKQPLQCRRWDWKAAGWASDIGLESNWLGVGDRAGKQLLGCWKLTWKSGSWVSESELAESKRMWKTPSLIFWPRSSEGRLLETAAWSFRRVG